MNYFTPRTVAERYVRGRLRFHPTVVGRVRKFLSLTEPVAAALDVGCGTGLSTIALKEIAHRVTGVDASAQMVARAEKRGGVGYLIARAERLPFGAGEFDLVTLSQVFHWLDRDLFLAEARRVLRRQGWLVVYDDYFSAGRMTESPELRRWYAEKYLRRYPPPPRAELKFEADEVAKHGFRLLAEDWRGHTVVLSKESLVEYLLTQSNVIAAVEGGREELEDARARLLEGLGPVFGDAREKEFLFDSPVWYLQRAD
jgi:SAM-dependent methyltransferase